MVLLTLAFLVVPTAMLLVAGLQIVAELAVVEGYVVAEEVVLKYFAVVGALVGMVVGGYSLLPRLV